MKREVKDEKHLISELKKSSQSRVRSGFKSIEKVKFENIDFKFTINVKLKEVGLNISFNNCSFSGARIDITLLKLNNQKCNLDFQNCKVNCNFFIKDSDLNSLSIFRIDIESSQFFISSNSIDNLSITGSTDKKNNIKSLFLIDNKKINFLDVRLNNFSELFEVSDNEISELQINANEIEKLEFTSNINEKGFVFWKNHLKKISNFQDSSIGSFQANENNLGIETIFSDNEFFEKSNFTGLKSPKTTLKFENCNFHKNTYFDNSTLLILEFKSVLFNGITSFQNLTCNHLLKFDTTHFEKIGFFEKSKIGSLNSIDINTIRTIKSQLLKSESKFEYAKFNALEQRKLFQKLSWQDSDFYILLLNKWSNDFGRDWYKGVKFTFKVSLFFFSLLILLNSYTTSQYPLTFKFNSSFANLSTILSEYLKFTFLLGFGNEEIQSNGYLYSIFILAKVFIGYGIYQTISAFRKYGRM